jgi:hypothetical protein
VVLGGEPRLHRVNFVGNVARLNHRVAGADCLCTRKGLGLAKEQSACVIGKQPQFAKGAASPIFCRLGLLCLQDVIEVQGIDVGQQGSRSSDKGVEQGGGLLICVAVDARTAPLDDAAKIN